MGRAVASGRAWSEVFSVETLLSALLVALLAIVPARDGSAALDAQALNAAIVMLMVTILGVSQVFVGRGHEVSPRRFVGVAALFGLGVAWVLIQYMPGIAEILEHPAWQMAREALGKPLEGRITVDPDLTVQGAMGLLSAAGMVWVAAQLAATPRRAYALLAAIAAINVAYAFYAVATNAISVPGAAGVAAQPGLRATFSNRNTYATYAGLGVVVSVALGWRLFRHALREAGPSSNHQIAALLKGATGTGMVWIAAIFVLGACLVMSASRGGVLSTAVALVVLTALTVRRHRYPGQSGSRRIVIAAAIAGCAAVIAVVAGLGFGDTLFDRVSVSGVTDGGRPFVYGKTIEAIAASPWLGYGYGTFAAVFPMYDDGTGDPFYAWDLAHNTYLEVLLGSGVPGGLLLIVPVVWLAWQCVVGALTRQRDATIPAIAAAASALVGLHAMIDFSLQYQGVGLTYAALLGIGFAQAHRPEGSAAEASSRRVGARAKATRVRT